MKIDKACWERGCPCYDSKEDGVEVKAKVWHGLGINQRIRLADRFHISLDAVEAIEAKLKERNT
jgi:hypothetical protein